MEQNNSNDKLLGCGDVEGETDENNKTSVENTEEGLPKPLEADSEQQHIHAGRYWFEIANNPENYEAEPEKPKVETITHPAEFGEGGVQDIVDIEPHISSECNQNYTVRTNYGSDSQLGEKPPRKDDKINDKETLHSLKNTDDNAAITEITKSINKSESIFLDDSSDDDVIEIEMPPLPMICLDSSDDESSTTLKNYTIKTPKVPESPRFVIKSSWPAKNISPSAKKTQSKSNNFKKSRFSPVPSIVSSASDDFLHIDCDVNELNISNSGSSFNFNLHGSDLAGSHINNSLASKKARPRKKNKKKQSRNVDHVNGSTSQKIVDNVANVVPLKEGCFATPKVKKISRKKNDFTVQSTLPVPCMDVYESESSDVPDSLVDVPINRDIIATPTSENSHTSAVDFVAIPYDISEDNYSDLIIANVSGALYNDSYQFNDEIDDDDPPPPTSEIKKATDEFQNENSSLSSAKKELSEIRKFYDESWGGENFDHKQMQKAMPADKNLWKISPQDLYNKSPRKTTQCNYCNQRGHRGDQCHRKPKLCFMCGSEGHTDWNCPQKFCLNCGSKSNLFINSCRQCHSWNNSYCGLCETTGHPTNRCPDNWRRYHLTTTNEIPLAEYKGIKPKSQQYCSGCANRGHVVSECKNHIKLFLDFKPTSVSIKSYEPLYTPDGVRKVHLNKTLTNVTPDNKRKSESDNSTKPQLAKSPKRQKSLIQNKNVLPSSSNVTASEIIPTNRNYNTECNSMEDHRVIQDNNVSNTNDAVSQVQILLTPEYKNKLTSVEGQKFLETLSREYSIQADLDHGDHGDVLHVTGTSDHQSNFQIKLKDWLQEPRYQGSPEEDISFFVSCIPRKSQAAFRKINGEVKNLNKDFGDPWKYFNRLTQSKKQHSFLISQENIDLKLLNNVRKRMCEDTRFLNMILIGQSGFHGGRQQVLSLLTRTQEIISRSPVIKTEEREELGRLYRPIFSSSPRHDYYNLLKQYNKTRRITPINCNSVAALSIMQPSKYVRPSHFKDRTKLHKEVIQLRNALKQMPLNTMKANLLTQLELFERKIMKAPLSVAEHNQVIHILNAGSKMIVHI